MSEDKWPRLQALMDKAYDRFKADWTLENFHDQLDAVEKVAVTFGNMNYQVENGGWCQWFDNGYGTKESIKFLKRRLEQMEQPAAKDFLTMLKGVEEAHRKNPVIDEEDWDERYRALDQYSSPFYAMNDKLMDAVEETVIALEAERLVATG